MPDADREMFKDVHERLAEWSGREARRLGDTDVSRRLVRRSRELIAAHRQTAGQPLDQSADVTDDQAELALAARQVERGEQLVARQRRVIARLSANALDLEIARELLDKLETSLATLRAHHDLIRRELATARHRAPSGPPSDGAASPSDDNG